MITDINVWPIADEEDAKEVDYAAYQDGGRTLLHPTHFVCKKGTPIGAFSIVSPTVHWWMHTEKASVRDSRMAWQSMDTLMRNQKTPDYIVVCEESSPYYKLMTNKCELSRPMEGRDWSLFRNKRE